ncbi:hypothetical protein BC941DRAFT_472910 [Chlamydoabsidia padenii]|nr:hypothetical protein BC941DRAFT_472910 [Chlamydoabsidia padenii]
MNESDDETTDSVVMGYVRLGVFAKNSIDVNNMNGVLTFQAVGRSVTFHIVKPMADISCMSLKIPCTWIDLSNRDIVMLF